MSDPDPDVTPEQEAQLRRLLARARHDEPVPDDVAARLDRVLAQLGQENRALPDSPAVVELHHRRRRRVAALLVAAAVVVVGGVGLSRLPGPGDNDSSATSGAAVDPAAAASAAPSGSGGNAKRPPAADVGPGGAAVRLTERGFTRQVGRIVAAGGTAGPGRLTQGVCRGTSGPGRRMAVLYDGVPAVLVFRFPTATTQVVELQRCGTGEVLRSTTLAR